MTEQRITERIERLLNRIPGYTGYRQKESMRDDDRRLRQEMARELTQAIDQLTAASSRLAAGRKLDQVSAVEDTIGRVRQLESRVRTATYGYGGLFSDRPVDEYALQQLKQFDVAFQQEADAVTELITAAIAGEAVDASALQQVDQKLAELNRLFDTRGDVIETATPTRDPDVLALLEKPREITPQQRQLLGIRRGGTGAILGDNYQFTSHVVLTAPSGAPALTMVELDGGPEWLAVVDNGQAVDAWRVTSTDAAGDTGGAGQPAKADVSGPSGASSDVMASYQVTPTGSGDDASASIVIDLAGSVRAYRGPKVPLIDIQVFSESGNLS
jgi:hypothetical protein